MVSATTTQKVKEMLCPNHYVPWWRHAFIVLLYMYNMFNSRLNDQSYSYNELIVCSTVGTPVGVASFFIIVHLDGDINLEKEKKGSLEPSNKSKKKQSKDWV